MAKIGKYTLLLMFVLFGFSVVSQAQVTVSASATSPVAAGEDIDLTITVSSDSSFNIDKVQFPSMDGFTLDERNVSESARTTWVNGQVQAIVTRVYPVTAERPGHFRIGEIEVTVDGTLYRTKPLEKINVLAPGAQVQRKQQQRQVPSGPFGDDEADQLFSQLLQRHGIGGGGGFQGKPINPQEAYHVLLEVDKSKVYVGEQVTASWYLATRGMIREFDPLKYPQLKGFWKEDIEIATNLNFHQEVINGLPYKKALLMRSALFPIKEGTAIIDPYKTKATVLVGGAFGAFGQPYVFNKSSPELKIEVMPLPTQGRPHDFTGAVGQFQLTSTVATNQAAINQPVEYKIRVQGRGNAKNIDLPPLNLPPSLEIYDQKSDSKYNPDGSSYKDFVLYLIPRQAGAVTIPAASMSYFDPQTKAYVRKATPPVTIQVGAAVPGTENQPPALTDKKDNSAPRRDVPQWDLVVDWREPKVMSSPLQILMWVTVFTGILAFWLVSARAMGLIANGGKRRELRKELKTRLKSLRESIKSDDWRQVGAKGTNLIYYVVGELSEQGGAKVEISQLIEKIPPSLRLEMKAELEKLLSQLEILSFAPETMVGDLKASSSLKNIVAELEKCLSRAVNSFEEVETADKNAQSRSLSEPTLSL